MTTRGARTASHEEGTIALVVLRQQGHASMGLRSGSFGLRSSALQSNGHRRKRWSGRGRRPQATPRLVGSFRGRARRRACGVVPVASKELSWLATFRGPSSRGEGRHALTGRARAEAGSGVLPKKRLDDTSEARIGRSRVCPRVSRKLQKSSGGTGSREALVDVARDERAPPPGRDGDLVRSNRREAQASPEGLRMKRVPRVGSPRKQHVTATETSYASRVCVRVPRRWKAPRVRKFGSSSRRDGRSGLGGSAGRRRAKARAPGGRKRQRCQRYGSKGALGTIRRVAKPREPTEAGRAS